MSDQARFGNRYLDRDREWWRERNRGRDFDRDWDLESRSRDYGRGWNQGAHSPYYERGWEDYGRDRDWESRDRDWGWRSRSQGFGQDWDYDRGAGYGRDYGYDRDYDYRRPGGWSGRTYRSQWDWEEEPSWSYTETWWVVGPFTGVGPRGYQRSDERIMEDVCERLTLHGQINASDITVEVDNGEVMLTGSVNSRREKRMVEDTIDTVYGVRDIHNQLRVAEGDRRRISRQAGQMQGRQQQSGQIRQGMEVFGRDGDRIGRVKEVRQTDFLVARDLARDIYIPFVAAIVSGNRITLDVPSDRVDDQGWEMPEVVEVGREKEWR